MEPQRRSPLVFGLLLILIGGVLLAFQLIPGLAERFEIEYSWPLFIIGVGVFLFLLGILVNAPGLSIPAAIVSGIGGIFYWQNLTEDWESWSYIWTLIPGFVGVGSVLFGILDRENRDSIRGGAWLILISGVMFLVFSSFIGGLDLLGPYWPVLLILLVLILLARPFLRR